MDKPVMKGAHEVTIEVVARKRKKSVLKKVKAENFLRKDKSF